MHLAESLVLPTELERARSTGELVVFAGAGVSIGPPSNCPSFTELARHVAGPGLPWDSFRGSRAAQSAATRDRTRSAGSGDHAMRVSELWVLIQPAGAGVKPRYFVLPAEII